MGPPKSDIGVETLEIVAKEYGKSGVRLLHLAKHGAHHVINELEVATQLTLNSEKDFNIGDNGDIIATDTQKNTVYILAKQGGISTPEEFSLRLANHFISKYPWVVTAKIQMKQFPWRRIIDSAGKEHNHAFVSSPTDVRICSVVLDRGSPPVLSAGIRDLQVIKTTQSAFTGFVNDEFRSLPDFADRIFSTVVSADWTYNAGTNLDYDAAYDKVKAIVLDVFAGPADKGIFSPSVQHSQNQTQKMILKEIPEIADVSILMPNIHYFPYDFTKFPIPGIQGPASGQVLYPVDKPSGTIQSTLARNPRAKL